MARDDETGIDVYPRLPVPKPGKRDSDMAIKGKGGNKKLMIAAGGALVGGLVLGFVVRPVVMTDSKVTALGDQLGEATKATDEQKTRADRAEKSLVGAQAAQKAAEDKLDIATKAQKELADRVSEAETKAKSAKASQDKLQASVDKTIGLVSADGEQITLRLVDKVMFQTLDDQLTTRGKQVLDRVAKALQEMPEKQIWVQGHTDDQPIGVIPPKGPPPKPVKGAKPVVVPPPKFATNWELSAARALTVVHYLQDTAKIDPSRLAALAFGQYRPVSSNRASNRRIEIVLYPKPNLKK